MAWHGGSRAIQYIPNYHRRIREEEEAAAVAAEEARRLTTSSCNLSVAM